MSKITDKMIKYSYEFAKDVYNGKISINDAVKVLSTKYSMKETSAKDYINNYKHMRLAHKYARTMNEAATKYFLDSIYQEDGQSELEKALISVLSHLNYYESLRHVKLNGIRRIYEQYSKLISDADLTLYPEEKENIYKEGKAKQVYVNIYERDQNARKKCIEYYGYKCCVCGILLSDKYGVIGRDFIHIHHIKALSAIKKEYTVDPISDLRPVCPNCHAMIHRREPPYSIEELKEIIK